MERMARAFLERPVLLNLHGHQLFWSCWAALSIARRHEVTWAELNGLAEALKQVARRNPPGIAHSVFARSVSWLGPRVAATIRASKLLAASP
jgi:hypothetical protein